MKLSIEATTALSKIKNFAQRSSRTEFSEVDAFGPLRASENALQELVAEGYIDYVNHGDIRGYIISIKNME